jgi:hypothetical protein
MTEAERFAELLRRLSWKKMGSSILSTDKRYKLIIHLEPCGEFSITRAGGLTGGAIESHDCTDEQLAVIGAAVEEIKKAHKTDIDGVIRKLIGPSISKKQRS